MFKRPLWQKSVDPDQTAAIGAVCSGFLLFASILNSSVMLGNYLQQTTSADDIFRCIFFLGALRVNSSRSLCHFLPRHRGPSWAARSIKLCIKLYSDWSYDMRGSRNFRQGGPGQSDKKALTTFFFFFFFF